MTDNSGLLFTNKPLNIKHLNINYTITQFNNHTTFPQMY